MSLSVFTSPIVAVIVFCGASSLVAAQDKTLKSEVPESSTQPGEFGKGTLAGGHKLRWTRWERGYEDTEVYIDDVLFGRGGDAAIKLAALVFPKGTTLDIDFPKMPDGDLKLVSNSGIVMDPYYEDEGFLRKWICQGVHIRLKINGQPCEVHTLAVLDAAGNSEDPLYVEAIEPGDSKKRIILFDGHAYDSARNVITAIAKAPWTNASILMVCRSEQKILVRPQKPRSFLDSILQFLKLRYKVREIELGRSNV